ncbi:hypothetical protein [Ligilactobacillus acidipiscis]|uniref:hypothetical protein n=1 Tax=Ligilactobacillus acidipiscis TaxID=89059 RepID=UPI0022DF2ADA|nr:hypothetical protein [Ligilactobacillus acidipiscis]
MTVEYNDYTPTPESQINSSNVPQYNIRLANWIRHKAKGKDVREALAQLAEVSGSDLFSTLKQQKEINNLIDAFNSPSQPRNVRVTVNDDGTILIVAE